MYTPLELAHSYLTTGELSYALEALAAGLAQQPEDHLYRLRAEVLLRLTRYSEALADLSRIVTPAPEDHLTQSLIHERLGNMDAALAALAGAPFWAERRLVLLMKMTRYADACVLAESQGDDWRWREYAGDCHRALAQNAQAFICYTNALDSLHLAAQRHPGTLWETFQARVTAKRNACRQLDGE